MQTKHLQLDYFPSLEISISNDLVCYYIQIRLRFIHVTIQF